MIMPVAVFAAVLLAQAGLSAGAERCDVAVIGAGIGGLYSAWRLAVDSAAVPGHRVCVLEARGVPGGRILTVRDPVPGFKGYTIDLGAYRYSRTGQRHTQLLFERVLGFDHLCYSNLLGDDDGSCASPTRTIVSARGATFGLDGRGGVGEDALRAFSDELPWRIPPAAQWGPGRALRAPRSAFGLIFGPRSILPEVAAGWPRLMAAADYAGAMRAVDGILGAMRNGTWRGVPYADLGLHQMVMALGWTPEEVDYLLDTSGAMGYTFRKPVLYFLRATLRSVAAGRAPLEGARGVVTPAERRPAGGKRRIGLDAVLQRLLAKLRAARVRVRYNARVTFIEHTRGGRLRLRLADGSAVLAGRVIANIAPRDVLALGAASEPLKSGSTAFKRAVERNGVVGSSKMYCFWEDAWWVTKMNTTVGALRIKSENIGHMRYHDGFVTCTNSSRMDCRGGVLVSYQTFDNLGGGGGGAYAQSFNALRYTPVTNSDNVRRLIPGQMSPLEKLQFNDVWRQIKRVHKSSLAALGYDVEQVIQKPAGCVYADWQDMGYHSVSGPGEGHSVVEELYAEPVPGISLANEAWGEVQGWIEASLNSAERALFHKFKLRKPTWMDQVFHTSVIEKYNRGL